MFLITYLTLFPIIFLTKIECNTDIILVTFKIDQYDEKIALNSYMKRIVNEYFVVCTVNVI